MAMADTALPGLKVAKHRVDRPEPPHPVRARPAAQRRLQAWCSRLAFANRIFNKFVKFINSTKRTSIVAVKKTPLHIDTPLITLPLRLNQAGKIVPENRQIRHI